jgi:hypothetical protein
MLFGSVTTLSARRTRSRSYSEHHIEEFCLARRPTARPVSNFPEAVRELLEEARAEGLTFEAAWNRALDQVRPAERGWGPDRRDDAAPGSTETQMQFLRRVMRVRYEQDAL